MIRSLACLLLLAGPAPSLAADEPILGRCEGCEHVFVDRPAKPASAVRLVPAEEPGQRMVLQGTVRTRAGAPVPGIIVYAYQTNAAGQYPRGSTPHGSLRAWAISDAAGRYRFDTIRPGSYPSRDTPEHIHMHVIEPGRNTYYIDDLMFTDDPLLTERVRKSVSDRGGPGILTPRRDAQGVWQVQRDITLGLNVPGYR